MPTYGLIEETRNCMGKLQEYNIFIKKTKSIDYYGHLNYGIMFISEVIPKIFSTQIHITQT